MTCRLYTAAPADLIKVDGNTEDWGGHTFIGPVSFGIPKAEPTTTVFFEEYGGGTWTGPEDQTTIQAFAWSKDSFYVGVVVTDEYHQNSNSGWNGDALQLLITNENHDPYYLYNYGLNGTDAELGDLVKVDEKVPPAPADSPDFTVSRHGKATVYEVRIQPSALGLTEFVEGQKLGVAFAVNDGDEETPGQKGWGGFSPHALVFGKSPDKVGIVTLAAAGGGVVKPTPTVSISRSAAGVTTVTYVGTLQSATSVAGPYADVAGASSPYAVNASAPTYYRTRQ